MKKLLIIATVIAALFTSCKKDTPTIKKEGLKITFNHIDNAKPYVDNIYDVAQWNYRFDTEYEASTQFTDVEILGNSIIFYGATNLNLRFGLFDLDQNIISVEDYNSVISVSSFALTNVLI